MRTKRIASIIINTFYLFFILSYCSKKPGEEPHLRKSLDAGKFTGSYFITPSFRKEEVIIGPGTDVRFILPGEEVKKGRILLDEKVLRIFLGEESNPSGTFLLSAYNENGWRGFWKGEIRELKRK